MTLVKTGNGITKNKISAQPWRWERKWTCREKENRCSRLKKYSEEWLRWKCMRCAQGQWAENILPTHGVAGWSHLYRELMSGVWIAWKQKWASLKSPKQKRWHGTSALGKSDWLQRMQQPSGKKNTVAGKPAKSQLKSSMGTMKREKLS